MNRTMAVLMTLALAACDSGGIAGTDPCEPSSDEDGDTITNIEEGCEEGADTDGDTLPDYRDEDSDNDMIPDQLESGDSDIATPAVDSDGDGTPDFRDSDSDGNGVPDIDEGVEDTDDDDIRDYVDPDNDDDHLEDDLEIGRVPSHPTDWDADGIPDYNDADSDNDTISDRIEQNVDIDEDGIPDRHDLDTDDDGITDQEEAGDSDLITPPVDSDGDFIPDFRDRDSDNDGLSDAWEAENGTDPTNSDSDMDVVPDLIEVEAGTDPLDATSNPRTEGNFVFYMYYNEPGMPDDEMMDPEPTMDHLVFTSTTTGPLTAEVVDDPTDMVDAPAEFLERVEPSMVGGWPDPRDVTVICVRDLDVDDREPPLDGHPDTFTSVVAGTAVCFDIIAKMNDTVPCAEEVLFFSSSVHILDGGDTVLDTRTIWFIVPPCPFYGL